VSKWVVDFRNIDSSRDFTKVYRTEQGMLRALGPWIRAQADEQINDMQFHIDSLRGRDEPGSWTIERGRAVIERLDAIRRDLARGRLRDAVDGWLEYQGEMGTLDDQIDIREAR
jgi:hypothetical protein